MISISQKNLKNISALLWITGGVILFIKGYLLLRKANLISPNIEIISLVMASAFIIGLLKNKLIMSKFNRKNIDRINNLSDPQIHHIFETRFFFYLGLMILTGILLSSLAAGNYNVLLFVGGIDLALSTALLKSSTIFFTYNK